MTTDTEHEESVQIANAAVADPPAAIEELLEFMREHVRGDMTHCPVCDLLVPISARRCQHCDSNIEANNALVRETLRHIEEVTSQLDEDGGVVDRAWRSFKNRIKRKFGRTPTIEEAVPEDSAQHALTDIHAGDQITVVEIHGAWALVRTTDGREGWIYSLATE